MRPVLCTLTLLLALAPLTLEAGTSAPHVKPECPAITIECEKCLDATMQGDPATFTVKINGADANFRPGFNWTVSEGTIIKGQGTNSITVDTKGLADRQITATVEVSGIRGTCPKTASFTRKIIVSGHPRKFDEYGDIDFEDEKARLDNFAFQLHEESTAVGYILVYAGRRARVNEAEKRLDRAKNHLVNERGIQASRIVTIDGGYREELTVELWALPANFPPIEPDATSTIDPGEVEIIPDPAQPKRPRKQNR
ncbi:MAG TPA: hypothetical protein VM911_03930 [Pyrinomonadaceae bacterium]|jgi:hypothetical protein|nr:hypothetical protein [Pyrinomonadaceae bacterium]